MSTLLALFALTHAPVPFDDWDGLRSAIVALGDVDGDSLPDFALAHRPRPFFMMDGATPLWPKVEQQPLVWVLSGVDGAVLQVFQGGPGYGTELVAVGDLDADGVCDLAVSDGRDQDSNTVHLLSVGKGIELARFENPEGVSGFGRGLAGGEQLVGDPTPDLVIGAEGCAWIVDGALLQPVFSLLLQAGCRIQRRPARGWEMPELRKAARVPQFGEDTPVPGASFASNVAVLADMEGDGRGEVVLTGAADGSCSALRGSEGLETGHMTHVLFSTPQSPALVVDSAGWLVLGGRDLDGDGVPDLVTASVNHSLRAWSVGARALLWEQDYSSGYMHAEGASLDFTDDHDGDGVADLVLTANETFLDADSGFVSIVSGKTGDRLLSWNVPTDFDTRPPGAGGADAASLGDLDGDGLAELAFQTPFAQEVGVLNGSDLSIRWSIPIAQLSTGELERAPQPMTREERVDQLFAEWTGYQSPGAAVGIYQGGELLYAQGYGVANMDLRYPMRAQTALRIGSISKQFTAMCIALLQEEGRLASGDDIRKYLPEMPDYGAPITIGHLLHHTSGIREYLALVELIGKPEGSGYVYTTRELVQMLARQRALDFPTGERFSYSNSGYFLLAEIVTRVSGMKASAFARERIFEPLGMDGSRFHDEPNAIIPNRGFGYSPLEDGGFRMDILRLDVIGDLGVVTSVQDMLHWENNFRSNRLGRAEQALIDTLHTRGKLNDGTQLDYAWGVSHGVHRGLRTLGHGGSAVGYVSQYTRYPDQDLAIAVLSNLSSFSPGRRAREIAEIYLEDEFAEVEEQGGEREWGGRERERPEPVELSAEELEAYSGEYYSEELDIVYALEVVDAALQLELRERVSRFEAFGEGRFRGEGVSLQFFLDGDGVPGDFEVAGGGVEGIGFERVLAGDR